MLPSGGKLLNSNATNTRGLDSIFAYAMPRVTVRTGQFGVPVLESLAIGQLSQTYVSVAGPRHTAVPPPAPPKPPPPPAAPPEVPPAAPPEVPPAAPPEVPPAAPPEVPPAAPPAMPPS